MLTIGFPCDTCKHLHKELLKGWNVSCDAYPEGIPLEYIPSKSNYKDPREMESCAPDFKYERKED
jgi:hypothetical protein